MKKILSVTVLIMTAFMFNSCLTLSPYMPSARIIPDDSVSLSAGAGRLSFTADRPVYGYDEYYYSFVSYTTKAEQANYSFDLGASIKLTGTNAELGVSTRSFTDATFNFRLGLTDPKDTLVHAALDTYLHTAPLTNNALGISAGLVLNVPVIFEMPLDIVIAAYYQASKTPNNYYSYSTYTHPVNSMHYYAGLEFPMRKDAIFIGGVSYTRPFDSSNDSNPVYVSLGIKTLLHGSGSQAVKPSKKETYSKPLHDTAIMLPEDFVKEATFMISSGSYKEAAELLMRGLESYPGENTIKKLLADCYYSSGDVSRALKLYYELLEEEPWNKTLQITIKSLQKEINNGSSKKGDDK